MKDGLKIVIYIILVMLITFILCCIFIKPKVLNIKEIEEYKYIQKNKINIKEVIIRNETQLGIGCYKLDTNKAYEILSNIEIKKETGGCYSNNKYLEFYFNDGISKKIKFECENLIYDGKKYELEDKVVLFNKDEYMPEEITKGMIIVSNEDKVECR